MMRRLALLVVACVANFAACASTHTSASASGLFPKLQQAGVRIASASGTHRFTVWIAADDASRAQGLMHVRELPHDRGMLFLLERAEQAAFWMKDTPLSLDILFIATDGRIVNIARRTQPHSLAPIVSAGPVKAVLEVVAGTADRLGIVAGDRVRHPAFEKEG